MRHGKWYKVYYRFNDKPSTKSRTITVWAFSFASAAATAKIKLGAEKKFDPEKILVTRIDLISQ